MQFIAKDIDIRVDDSVMRLYVAVPRDPGKYPGILLYSEIFQLTGPIRRSVERLAGHGFVVAAPEIYHRIERPGVVIPYGDIGRMWGMEDAYKTSVAQFDADAKATLDFLSHHPQVAEGKLASMGFCIGGHLAWRAALDARVSAAVCCYPTGVHNGKLGHDADAKTLPRLDETRAEMLIVFGQTDPHVPAEGRKMLIDALAASKVRHNVHMAPGEHAFMRDEGARYDPASADDVWSRAISLFHRTFA
jgi:carboxymethylenebutenolidase